MCIIQRDSKENKILSTLNSFKKCSKENTIILKKSFPSGIHITLCFISKRIREMIKHT